jgi:hypothetical protein
MNVEAALILVDREVYRYTNKHLTDIQQAVITNVLFGRKYLAIADEYGCTEGHVKDTAYLLWKLLAQAGEKKLLKATYEVWLQSSYSCLRTIKLLLIRLRL